MRRKPVTWKQKPEKKTCMPAVVIPIGRKRSSGAEPAGEGKRAAFWSLLEIARPGRRPVPYGILLADEQTGELTFRLRDPSCFTELDEQEADILDALPEDLRQKGRDMGGLGLLDWLEDGLSDFFRISDRARIERCVRVFHQRTEHLS